MATLPRAHNSKYGKNISFPFSTSPRKLQEMTLPAPDGHDMTASSGISMKQYEEQLNGLRKENFHLKLRVYFLEEKLGTGAPPAAQGLLEHNVRLQVEVEELRRQLSDKQELLAAAAEAIDVLEQQGSISNDSVDASIDNCSVSKQRDNITYKLPGEEQVNQTCDECTESESAVPTQTTSVEPEGSAELPKLRRENRKALLMIKSCMKKIQQQDREIKKLKLDKELVYAHVSDSQLEKYEEIVKCKDQHIKDLESKIKELQMNAENAVQNDNSGNLQELLTRRLQGLAYFLDKLLSHKCVLGEDKKKLAESILEQSLALPVGLKLDETMAPEDFTMDESNLEMSQSLRLEDLTMMFGHHLNCSDDNRQSCKRVLRHLPQADIVSESECWSEPDRTVSLARMGLAEAAASRNEANSDTNRHRSRRSKVSFGSRSEDNKLNNEAALLEEVSQLIKQIEVLEYDKTELNEKLEYVNTQLDEIIAEKNNLNQTLAAERANLLESHKITSEVQASLAAAEARIIETEQKLANVVQITEKLQSEKQELEAVFAETELSLRRAADEATIQASQAALERAHAQHDRLKVEKELEETREKLANVIDMNAHLRLEVANTVAMNARMNDKAPSINEVPSEDDRPTSPDQGIDSDRLSSLEQNDAVLSPRSLYEENVTLKQKLARTKATLADTLAQLNAANLRKRNVQRAICREIHKTQGVLRKARDQFENQNGS